MDVLRGKWKEKCILNVCALLILCWSVDPSPLVPPLPTTQEFQCLEGSHYHTANGTCCRKCHEGFMLKEHCTKNGDNSLCVHCQEGRTYLEKSNYAKNCLRCTLCVDNEEVFSPCKKSKNTVCRCKKGFYQNRINSGTRECLTCKTCGPGERETQPCKEESDTVCECKDFYFRDKKSNKTCLSCKLCELTADCQQECSSGTHPTPNGDGKSEDTGYPYLLAAFSCVCLLLLVVVGIMGVLVVRRKRKGSNSFPSAEITSQVSETSTRRLIQEDPENVLNQCIPSCSPVCECEQEPLRKLPDCVPKEIKISELIYSVLDQVPTRHMKELVRSLGRKLKQKVVADYTTVSKGASGSFKPRAALRQVLFSQGATEKSPMPEGAGQLDALKRTLEAFPVPVCLNWSWGEEGTGATLENNWTDIVHNHSMMCKTQRHQQEALWELVHTELTYINKLTVVTDLVMAALTHLHQHGFLLEVTPESLFSNLPFILSAHRLFWQEVMYPMLQEVRRTGKPFDPMGLEAGCLQFPERFSPYLHYCCKEESTVDITSKLTDTNLHFHTYLMWVEAHPQCERMRLGDMQAKPIQRITKYPLLLKAVLKTTQAPHTQHTLRGMLACVNGFLHSINDYLRLKDDEQALSLSAQKIEGYDVMEGMNEEIEKHVRELCSFDLTCPVRGVGPGVIRKLLLEETLKIRGRKDHKLEVTALLFSDVLLVTKVQKKAERLKVVRPPLALDRTRCDTLKDGCSFVVVEVSVLGCAANVYTFSTSSPESCSTWVFTIHEAQETLQGLRETEASRRLQTKQRDLQLQEQATPPTEPKMTIEESVDQPPDQSEAEITSSLEVKPVEELLIQSVNGTLVSIATEAEQQTQEPVDYKDAMLPGQPRKLSDIHNQSFFQPQPKPNGPHNLLLGRYPDIDYDIDYPRHQSSTFPLSPCRENNRKDYIAICQMESQGLLSQGGRATSTRRNSAPQSVEQQAMRNSWLTQSGEEEALAESWRFSRKLNSPRLRRRRPINTEQTATPQMSQSGSDSSGMAQSAPRTNSSSNSDSDCKQKLRGSYQHNSGSSGQSADSHLVLKLGSLKMNGGVFWDMPAEREFSPEPPAFSEHELPKDIPEEKENTPKRPKLKIQRSVSIPDIILQEGYSSLLISAKPSNTRIAHSPPPGLDPYLHPSPLESILNRAKERRKDRGRREGKGTSPTFRTWALPPSPSFSTTTSQSPSEGDRETEWEEVELVRRLAPSVSQGWIEERVDGDVEEEKKSSPAFPDGTSVDWPGWGFEADEVLDQLTPEDSGVGVDEEWWEVAALGLSQTLTLRDIQRIGTHEDGTISQV